MPAEGSSGLTWDGRAIAADRPTGSTVVVRRRTATGAVEALTLHRNGNGPDYEGDWAWTAPAGCRQPGEAVYPAALRELEEEAGLGGLDIWAVDLSQRWALFAVDVAADTEVRLVDPEHDRYEWLTIEQTTRVLPTHVGESQRRAAAVPTVGLEFRPMRDDDYGRVARWHREPHVYAWWDHDTLDEESVRAKYAAAAREPTSMWVVEADGIPAGMLQSYPVGAYPEYAQATGDPDAVGFDYLIGDPALIGRGVGTRMIWEFCRDVLRREYPSAPRFLASPDPRNLRSLRVLDKCGFARGPEITTGSQGSGSAEREVVCTLDVAHWLGH